MNYPHLTKTLVESFNALADEVQSLIDRKTILEHKLRFAHEQYQYIADKYAPAAPEISETLAKLQLPPDLHHSILETTNFVPLPTRGQSDTQHQIALFIREGRKVAQQLASLTETGKESSSSKEALSPFSETESMTSISTVLEQDFTVEGRKGLLECPFSKKEVVAEEPNGVVPAAVNAAVDSTPHQSADPICAAMYEETMPAPAPSGENGNGSASKCPIRFLDQHSPEEIAQYVEKHKHQIPRSHEVCVRRYQKSQEQIRMLDAKYGNLASMIQSLSHLHQPMLPTAELGGVDQASNERVETWAHGVSVTGAEALEEHEEQEPPESVSADERESHFDRPLKEVRVGESPSRPWGISVPVHPTPNQRQHPRRTSSPAAPVRMPSPEPTPKEQGTTTRKCPFDHTKLPFPSQFPKLGEHSAGAFEPSPRVERPFTPIKNLFPPASQPPPTLPTFVNPPIPEAKDTKPTSTPQMVFNITGPVFIGYPMEQAMQFMQNFQGGS